MSMTFEMDIPEDIGGESPYLKAPGVYHATVSTVHEESFPNSTRDSGGSEQPIPGGFSVNMEVVGGEQANKRFSLIFWGPKFDRPEDDKGNLWARKKQAAFAIACDLITLDTLGKRAQVNLQDAVGSQVIVELQTESHTGRDGNTYEKLVMSWANIFHIDDPRGKDVVRNQKLIDSIPAANRHKPEYFDALIKGKKQSASAPARETTRVTDADLDDI
jgi:hypothetical protein